VFTEPLLRNDRLFIRLLHRNGCTRCLFRDLCLATGLCATIYRHLSTKFRMRRSTGSLVIAINLEDTETYPTAAMLLFYILQKKKLS
jgi:hypothetical protein